MATVQEIEAAGITTISGETYKSYEGGHLDPEHPGSVTGGTWITHSATPRQIVRQKYDNLAKARCYPFVTTWTVEESASDIERTYSSVSAHWSMGFFAEVNGESVWISWAETINAAKRGDLTLLNQVDAYNLQFALANDLPTTYAACAAEGDTTSDYARYLRAKDITIEELANFTD